MVRHQGLRQLVVAAIFMIPCVAWAQSGRTGSIAGAVKDTTGAVMPGVTVEASSPALIEKVRTAVTDGNGEYKLVDLQPGQYTVTFTLAGFRAVQREGLELNSGVTLPVGAELTVGSVEETITVSGASPLVDVQNVRNQNVLTRAVLDTLPSAKNTTSFAALTLGASMQSLGAGDNGGTQGETVTGITVHAQGEGLMTMDGMRTSSSYNVPTAHRYIFNQMAVQEIVLETSQASAENQSGGVNVNMVSKAGGNVFSGSADLQGTSSSLQANNLTDDLRARGLTATNKTKKLYDLGIGAGGALKKDKLWIFAAARFWGTQEYQAGVYFNSSEGVFPPVYTPDLNRQAFYDKWVRDSSARLTWQVTEKQKVTFFAGVQSYCWCYFSLINFAPEGTWEFHVYPSNIFQATWTYPVRNKLLFEAGAFRRDDRQLDLPTKGTSLTAIPVLELSTGLNYGSDFASPTSTTDYGDNLNQQAYGMRAAASYVTGSHALRVGVQTMTGKTGVTGGPLPTAYPVPSVKYNLLNGQPSQLQLMTAPFQYESRLKLDLGIFAQDQWTIKKLTLNLGVRFDYHNGYNPAQTMPATVFSPDFKFPLQENVPNWRDISPRLGVAYDVFGNGKTALKASWGRYVQVSTTDLTKYVNGYATIAGLTTRTWTDTNGDFIPNCNLQDSRPNGECGADANQSFGTVVPNISYAKNVTEGFGVRPYQTQVALSVQQEVRPGWSARFGYYRTSFGNWANGGIAWNSNAVQVDNLAVAPGDFTRYCVTTPNDPRLPGGGGQQVCNVDVSPTKFGQVNNLVQQNPSFGAWYQVYNGIEAELTSRFGQGGLFTAGVSTGQTHVNKCGTPDTDGFPLNAAGVPQMFCDQTQPYAGQTQIKISGAYPLPWWGILASAKFQNLPGAPVNATWSVPNALIAPALGRNLGACGTAAVCSATALVQPYAPYTVFEPRYSLLDVRLSKTVKLGSVRLNPRFDVFNLLNSITVLSQSTAYGATFRRPITTFSGRLIEFGGRIDF